MRCGELEAEKVWKKVGRCRLVLQGFVVLNRPYAFAQWVDRYMSSIPERYVLMSEPDHLFIRPPPLW